VAKWSDMRRSRPVDSFAKSSASRTTGRYGPCAGQGAAPPVPIAKTERLSAGRSSDLGARPLPVEGRPPTATASRSLNRRQSTVSNEQYLGGAPVAFVLQYRCASVPDSHRVP